MTPNSVTPGFTGSPLDRTDENRPRDEVIAAWRAHPEARVMLLDALDPVIAPGGGLAWMPLDLLPPDATTLFLGLHNGAPRFVAASPAPPELGLRQAIFHVAATLPEGEAAIYACARSLLDWHRRHGFCANCGVPTHVTRGGWARRCDSCEADHFPRTDPVVIMLAIHDDHVLLGRQPRFPPGSYSALAGFVEVGESIEEAVTRELREEAGIIVHNVRYVASQPWPFPSSLMIGCFADAQSPELNLDTQELEDAFWASRQEVRDALSGTGKFGTAPPYAIAHTLLRRWAESG